MSKMTIKLRESTPFATDPESDKFEKDVMALLRKRYIKNFSKWLAKRGKVVTDKDGNHFVNMLATYYDEERSVSKAAGLLNDWIMANDSASFADDPSDAGFYLDRKVFADGKPSEAKQNEDFETPKSKEDLIRAVEKIREGWWTLFLGLGSFHSGPYGDLINDVMNDLPSNEFYSDVWGSSFDEIPMDEWADALIRQIMDYKE